MKPKWEMKKIGDIAYHDIESMISIEADKTYSMVGVYSYGKGLFVKDDIMGLNTSYKKFYKLKFNHIVLSQLFGWEGAISLCSKEFEGKYVSSQFPTFLVNEEIADKIFVSYYLQQSIVWKKLFEVGVGMGSRRRTLIPSNLLNLDIPFPPLPEQKRIVLKLESVKQRIEQIKTIRVDQEKEINYLRNSIFIDLQKQNDNIPIGKIIIPHNETIKINPEETYKQVTVKMEHKGVQLRGLIKGIDIGSRQYLANENDFIISKIDARNGAMGIIPASLNAAVVTSDFPLFRFTEEINPKFFYYFSNTYYFDNACKKASEGTTNRKRLKMDKFKNILMPLITIKEQNRVVSLLDKLNIVKATNINTEEILAQLMPALLDEAFKGNLLKTLT